MKSKRYFVWQEEDFYPRPPRGGRRRDRRQNVSREGISIHALREEGDIFWRGLHVLIVGFLSTPSARRATCGGAARLRRRQISIHALREEGDSFPLRPGESCTKFLSTPSARRATTDDLPL